MSQRQLKIAVLVSGSGSNLQILIDAMQSNRLPIQIVGVISNREDAYAITRAQQANIDVAVFSHTSNGKRMSIATFEKHALERIAIWAPDLVLLAGFMRVLSAQFIQNMPCAMINLHPSLLPAYKGLDTHIRVIQSGERYHGCSVHLVTPELDAGQVLTQAWLAVRDDETPDGLAKRVQQLEHWLVPHTLNLIVKGILELDSQAVISTGTLPYKFWLN